MTYNQHEPILPDPIADRSKQIFDYITSRWKREKKWHREFTLQIWAYENNGGFFQFFDTIGLFPIGERIAYEFTDLNNRNEKDISRQPT